MSTNFFDERLGHYLWHTGMLGLAALLIYHEWRRPASTATFWWATILAGIVYAFFFVSCLLAFLFFAGWWLYWGGFPQFSDVGLI